MNENSQKEKVAFTDLFVPAIIGFFAIDIVSLLLTPLTLFVFLRIDNTFRQPFAGIIASVSVLMLMAVVIIILQNIYRAKLTRSIVYGVWAAWVLQFALSFVGLLF